MVIFLCYFVWRGCFNTIFAWYNVFFGFWVLVGAAWPERVGWEQKNDMFNMRGMGVVWDDSGGVGQVGVWG